MAPDGSKVDAVVNWPQPRDEAEVGKFLGLASYYCKYIDKFADIAAPPTPADSERCSLPMDARMRGVIQEAEGLPDKGTSSVKPVVWHRSQHYGVTDRCQQCRVGVGGSPGTRTASDWLCQSHTHQSRSQLQCDPTGVSSHCVGDETVPPLPVGPHISTHDRPRPTAVACSTEDGGPPVSLRSCNTGIQF